MQATYMALQEVRTAVQGNIQAARTNLLDALDDIGVLGEVNGLKTKFFSLLESFRNAVNANDALSTLQLRELRHTKSDGTKTL